MAVSTGLLLVLISLPVDLLLPPLTDHAPAAALGLGAAVVWIGLATILIHAF